jgi:predicted dehydrogenase
MSTETGKLRVGIVGCGLIGGKRAAAMGKGVAVTAVCDRDPARAQSLAAKTGAVVCATDGEVLDRVDAVIVATSNDELTPIATRAVTRGKHVMLEKPGARSAPELEGLAAAARATGVVVRVGYNHRFHPAALKAKEILDSGVGGPLMFVRARYGHGGRIGYDKEWRAVPAISGGGELIDQGVHLIDLARWYMGTELTMAHAELRTTFWDMPVEDNAFLTLTAPKESGGQVAHLHASCTEWKNLFSFEIYAKHTKLHLEGLGGSYGVERLHHYQMRPEMGPPDTIIYEYPGADTSWAAEWAAFERAIATGNGAPGCGLEDAIAAMRLVDMAYAASTNRGP